MAALPDNWAFMTSGQKADYLKAPAPTPAAVPTPGAVPVATPTPGATPVASPVKTPTKSPGIVSTESLRTDIGNNINRTNNLVADIRARAEKISQGLTELKGQQTAQPNKKDDVKALADELGYQDPLLAQKTTYQKQKEEQISQIDSDYTTTESLLDTARKRVSVENAATIDAIKAMYAVRKTQLEDINKRALASYQATGIREGTERYAPLVATGILSAEERAGIARLAELDAQESNLVAQANAAATQKDFELLEKKLTAYDKARNEKNTLLEQQYKTSLEIDKEIRARAEEQRKIEADRKKQALEYSERVAGSVLDQLETLPAGLQSAFITETAMGLGIDPAVFAADVSAARVNRNKELLNQENIESQIADRTAQQSLDKQRLGLESRRVTATEGQLALDRLKAQAKGEIPLEPGQESQVQKDKITALKDTLSVATSLLTEAGKSGAVGAGFQKSIPFVDGPIPGTAAADYTTGIDNLRNKLTLENLTLLKGPMSDKDILFLKSVGSRLSPSMSEAAFDKELKAVQKKLVQSLKDTEIVVKEISSGQVGTIPANEYDETKYEIQKQ